MVRKINKSAFKLRDKVYFDGFKKEGIVCKIGNEQLTIFSNKNTFTRHEQVVFKKNETFGPGHWDSIKKQGKIKILNKYKVSKDLASRDWLHIPGAIKKIILKGESEFSSSGINTDTQNVYNPVSSDKTISDRIDSELDEQARKKIDDLKKEEQEALEKSSKVLQKFL